MRVLLVEDNTDLAASIYDFLEQKEVIVDHAFSGSLALSLLAQESFDIIILDLGLPDYDGIELCNKIKQEINASLPIIILSARSTLGDKLKGFDVGVDDYLTKPFDLPELYARLCVLTQRQSKTAESLKIGEVEYNLSTGVITRQNNQIILNRSCQKILKLLMQNSPHIVTKQDIEYILWGDDIPDGDILKTHMHFLRKAIDKPFSKNYIHTIRGIGYSFSEDST